MSIWNLCIDDVSGDTHALRNKLSSKEGQIAGLGEREIQLIREKEEALDELVEARRDIAGLEKKLRDVDIRDRSINERAIKSLKTCDDLIMMDDSYLIDMESLEPQPPPLPASTSVSESDVDVFTYIERLLAAIDRLRCERDSLRHDVQFLESETRFTIEALEVKLSASIPSTISQLKAEKHELHCHLAKVSERNAAAVKLKNVDIKRLALAVQTLAVVLDHSSSQPHRKDFQWAKDLATARTAEQETGEELEDVPHWMSEVTTHLQDVESERDSLNLQITNLMADMQNVQEELTNAESRYTSLQFHQLSNATRNLREQIGEVENRVMRRTEPIGIHQHGIKRLETKLCLQEERLGEMTTELEMMATQKDAMVEDCADAREVRNKALIRVERLEEEMESLEARNVDNTVVIESLIATIAQTVCQAREAVRLARGEVAEAQGTPAQQSTVTQQLQEKETALHKSVEEYQNEQLTTTLSQCQREVKHLSALATNLQQENLELVSQLENSGLRAQNHEISINDLRRLNQELRASLQEQQLSLTRIQKEHATQVDRSRDEHLAVKQELEQKITSLQGRIEEHSHLLDTSKREVARIRLRLQEETEGRAQDKKQHAMALLFEKDRNDDAAEMIYQLRGELETLGRIDQQKNLHLQSAEDEKLSLQQQVTELEAEIQRSKSLSRFLEIQIKDSDQLVGTLKSDIECTKADVARSEKSWKAAEINLNVQTAQHKREMTELRRELSAFRSRPDLEQALAELEGRNSEMEELLRSKCAEIEENDDRALEILKEKKKLTTRVESLNCRVQTLQFKLAAAKASNAVQSLPESQLTPPALPLSLTSPTHQSANASIPGAQSAAVSSVTPIYPPLVETSSTSTLRDPSNRVVSGPSFSTLQSRFTPTRNQNIPPILAMRSPRRGAPSRRLPLRSDLTNSPHHLAPSVKPSKRSWLETIRANRSKVARNQNPLTHVM